MIIDLKNKQGFVTGIANEQSIAYGCAEKFREAKADLATTFLNAIFMSIQMQKKNDPHYIVQLILNVGNLAAFLVSDAAIDMTGQVYYVDLGYSIMG